MWNCDFLPFSGGWGGAFFPGGMFSLLIWGFVILLFIYFGIKMFRNLGSNSTVSLQDKKDSMSVLKTRFAKGEVSQEEFIKMKQTLSQS
ncbi:MAG: hypothetical protein L3J69_02430 [Desulfobacula sp.]|nr:hypothetical protein [Desulfobacula sp.]